MNLIILGAPGAGKGTCASRIAVRLGISHIAMGDLLREFVKKPSELAEKIKSFMKQGSLVPDKLVIKVLKQQLGKKGFILDGFPRTKQQAEALKAIINIDAVINLQVLQSVIIERLSARRLCPSCNTIYNLKTLKPKKDGICDKCNSSLCQREDDKPDVIKQRLEIYSKETMPVLDCFKDKRIINEKNSKADISPEIRVDKILKELSNKD